VSAPQRRDAIIVGGGPAGSTLARALVREGLSVALLDKRTFPRDKTCAGWITPAVVETLGLDLDDYRRGRVLQPIHGFRLGAMGAPLVENRHGPAPVSYGIRRFEFDHYLLERSGAELRLGSTVETLQREPGGWIVNQALRAPLLVGAGGHFCPVARALGADLGHGECIVGAQEFEVRLSEAQAARSAVRGDTPQFYFYPDLAGYAWVFRKGDWLNVGIGRKDPHRLSHHIDDFVAALVRDGALEPEVAQTRPKGHAYLLYTQAARPLVADGALLVGDAAGLAYAESGEGIRPAVESALLAAQAIRGCGGTYSAQNLSGYARAVEARYGRRHTAAQAPGAPGALKRFAAALLLRTHWFTRDVVTRRWFLHEHVAPLRT
jgi:geranylgeranyl reductase family protein